MNSFIYIYSKFTEEILLLGGALIFTLLSAYCYEWVIKKRRLGAARNQVPAAMVKVYLNQLIHEAQFVRTQLFGLVNGLPPEGITLTPSTAAAHPGIETHESPAAQLIQAAPAGIGGDLEERLKALQSQLTEKESIVVNINVEKTKLLEEIENLRQNQKAMQSAGSGGGNSDELLKKIKELEARLEEYSLFEDDLANLKRLQQENLQLRKKLEDLGTGLPAGQNLSSLAAVAPTVAPTVSPALAPAPEPVPAESEAKPSVEPTPKPVAKGLDQSAIDALLEGKPATPPETIAAEAPQSAAPAAPAPATSIAPEAPKDEFEKLVSSVDTSLDSNAPKSPVEAAPAAPSIAAASPAEPQVAKSDEDLLKEFENLLNS